MPKGKNAPLSVEVVRGELVIRIGIGVLAHAALLSEAFNAWDDNAQDYRRLWKITDPVEFANDVRRMLREEEEDGSTPLSDLLDSCCLRAVEDGSLGADEDGRLHTTIEDKTA